MKYFALAPLALFLAAPASAQYGGWNGYPCAISAAQLNGAQMRFKSKYGHLAGDMPDATNYWGWDVVNGDGDGTVEEHEKHQACDHLSRSRLPMYSR